VANGIWLGLLGGAIGDLLGLFAAWVLMPVITNGSKTTYPGFHLPWLMLADVLFGGAVIGAIVSWIPAITAAKVDVLSTLKGVRAEAKVKVRAGIGGLLMMAAGLVIVVVGSKVLNDFVNQMQDNGSLNYTGVQLMQLVPVGGTVLILIGVLMSTGWLLVFVRAVVKKSGVATNYATNDLIYNRKRYQPVIASAVATGFLAATVMGFGYSDQKSRAEQYQPSLPHNQIQVDPLWWITDFSTDNLGQAKTKRYYDQLLAASNQDLTKQLKLATSVAEPRSSAVVARHVPLSVLGFAIDQATGNPIYGAEADQPLLRPNVEYLCPSNTKSIRHAWYKKLEENHDRKQIRIIEASPKYLRCEILDSARENIYVGTSNDLTALIGKSVPQSAVKALQSGQAVSFVKGFENHSKVTLDWYPSGTRSILDSQESEAQSIANGQSLQGEVPATKSITPTLKKTVTLESVFVETASRDLTIMISPETADSLGIDYKSNVLVVNYARALKVSERDKLNQLLSHGYGIDDGYTEDPEAWAWIILAIAGFFVIASTSIALGLAQIESRPDQATLGSIGAPRRFRAKVLSQQAFILTSLGTILGSAVGFYLSFVMTEVTGLLTFRFATVPGF
jgi:hypothetical protein